MKIESFLKKRVEVYISIDTEGAERRDAEPFVAFDTDVPYVKPLYVDGGREGFEVFERDVSVQFAREEEYTFDYEEIEIESEVKAPVSETLKLVKPMLLLPAPKAQKLLMAGKQPLLLGRPDELARVINDLMEAQHVVYFSDIEIKDGAEMVTEDKIVREKSHNFLVAKVASLIFMMVGLASILFPSISLKAAKVEYNVNPTNTTPGLSFAISSNDLVVQNNQGSLPIQTRTNQLVTSTLDLDVSTTGADGYKMYVTTSGTDRKGDYTSALVNKSVNVNNGEGAKINTLSADATMSAFPAGYWGYTTDVALQNVTTFKPFPTYDATDTAKYGGNEIASASTAIADDDAAGETPFTIGIKADSSLPAGSYENELLFTVITNPVTVTYNLNFDGNTTDSSLTGVPATVTETSSDVFKGITIPAGEPTRDDYVFVGWAESTSGSVAYDPGDEITLQVTDINDSQTVNKTLYAVWEQKEYLQDFDEENELPNVGDSKMLYDKRDDETYTVKRLPDGNVWMTQNLRHATGAMTVSSNTNYGGYYNWSNALNVCPAGWHLPSSSEQVTLDIAYGFSGETRTGAPSDVADYMKTDGNWPGFVAAGYYDDRSTPAEIRNADTHYAYWSRTADGNTGRENYAWYTTGNLSDFYPAYSNLKVLGFSVRCMAGEEKKKYLQEFNDAIDLRTVGNSDTYYDKRDGTAYTVKRLPDGKVWMTQNLAYTTGAYRVSDNAEYGAYYTWSVAQNVCPAGWHLPSGGSSGEYATLDRAYGYSGSNRTDAQAIQNYQLTTGNWPGMVLSGQYLSGTDYTGDRVLHWTSTASDSSNAYSFHFNTASSKPMYPVYAYPKTAAATVRCVGDQPNVFYIQDFDEDTMLPNTDDSAVLTDRRDGETYRVTRLADGNVWMTQNLRLTLTAGETLTATDTDAPASGLHVDYNTITSGGVAWDASTVRSYDSGVRDYGVYYNWYAATAGTRSTDYSICPSGWRLPSSTEYATLISTYSFNQTTVRNAPFYMATSDHYDPTGTPYNRGTLGHLWTSTANGNNAYFMFFNASTINNASQHAQSYGFAVRCVAREDAKVSFDANGGSGTMAVQTFTKGVRQAISTNTFTRTGYDFVGWALTPDATTAKYADEQPVVFNKATTLYAVWEANYMQEFDAKTQIPNAGDSVVLIDQRDGELYTAKRLPDGKVWMTQNLRYATGAYTVSSNTEYGGYYNWDTALNICPSGWHLPTGGDNGEFSKLDVAYGYSGQNRTDTGAAANYELSTGNWPGLVTAGYYYNGSLRSNVGIYWSQTVYNSTNAYNMLIDSRINPVDYGGSGINMSVRCIANEQETVSFNANGGNGTMTDMTVDKFGDVTLIDHKFTKSGYKFIGWATSADGAVAYAEGATLSNLTSDVELFAVWEATDGNMQDFMSCGNMIVGQTKTLTDTRDGHSYTVKKLSDQQCWMTENLRYETGALEVSENRSYGAYYNFDTATSVCPKGWHLPTGGSGGDFSKLDIAINSSIDSSAGSNRSSASATARANFASNEGGNPGFVYSGAISYQDWTLQGDGNEIRLWASTMDTSTTAWSLYVYGGIWPLNHNNSATGIAVRCIADVNTAHDGFLQDFNQDSMLLTAGDTATLMDKRDGRTYTVKRLADNKVWMTQNLGLVGPITLTSADSNVTSDFTLEASSNATSGWCKISGSTEQSCINRQQTYYDPSNPDDGALYNWYTATAGVGTYSVTSGSVNVDICPKGWHMPTGGSNSEIVALDKAYGYSGSSRTNATQVANYKSSTGNWPNFMPLKYISASSGTIQTSAFFIQSSTAKSNTTRYVFYLDNTNSIQPTRDSLKGPQAVRCIADYEEKTVSFNANGGTGTIASQTVIKGQSLTLPTNTMTRTDYNFLGWSESSSATTATYSNGETITVNDDMTLYAVWDTVIAFKANNLSWTKVLGQASFYNASSLCPSGYRIPTRAQLRALIGASADNVWMSNSTVTMIYNAWNQPHMVWSSEAYGSGGAYDLFFQNGQAIITATSSASSLAPVVCVK